MRSFPHISLLVVAMALLTACNKEAEPAAEKKTPAKTEQSAQSPFLRNGELLSVNVDAMPRQVFIAKMAELTGVKIAAEGDNSQPVTVHAVDASLRKILSMAIADAPYSATMQYANLQDSFPVSVVIGRYQAGSAQAAQQRMQALPAVGHQQLSSPVPSVAVAQPVPEEPAGPDFSSMDPNEQMTYFLSQPKEEQVSIIFDMEPTAQESELMTKLISKEGVSSEVKIEMLDSLSNGEYEKSAPAIKIALDAADPEVATKAVEVLAELGSEKDIPALKALAEKTDNEDVRTAVSDAIDTLQP